MSGRRPLLQPWVPIQHPNVLPQEVEPDFRVSFDIGTTYSCGSYHLRGAPPDQVGTIGNWPEDGPHDGSEARQVPTTIWYPNGHVDEEHKDLKFGYQVTSLTKLPPNSPPRKGWSPERKIEMFKVLFDNSDHAGATKAQFCQQLITLQAAGYISCVEDVIEHYVTLLLQHTKWYFQNYYGLQDHHQGTGLPPNSTHNVMLTALVEVTFCVPVT
jgi:hypothetical protein